MSLTEDINPRLSFNLSQSLCSLKITTRTNIKVGCSKVTNDVVHDDVSSFLGDVFMPQLDSFLPGEPETSRMLL